MTPGSWCGSPRWDQDPQAGIGISSLSLLGYSSCYWDWRPIVQFGQWGSSLPVVIGNKGEILFKYAKQFLDIITTLDVFTLQKVSNSCLFNIFHHSIQQLMRWPTYYF